MHHNTSIHVRIIWLPLMSELPYASSSGSHEANLVKLRGIWWNGWGSGCHWNVLRWKSHHGNLWLTASQHGTKIKLSNITGRSVKHISFFISPLLSFIDWFRVLKTHSPYKYLCSAVTPAPDRQNSVLTWTAWIIFSFLAGSGEAVYRQSTFGLSIPHNSNELNKTSERY